MRKLYQIALLAAFLFSAAVAVVAQSDDRAKGVELYNKGSYKEAADALQKIVKASPNDAEARTFLALAQVKLGKIKDAEKMLLKSLELDPNQTEAHRTLAFVYLLRGKMSEAVYEIERLRAIAPLDAQSFYILGLAHLRLGNNDLAARNADESIKLDPKFADVYLLKAHAIMNQWDGKTQNYKELSAKYGSSAENIGKFVMLSANSPDTPFWRSQQDALKIFAAYYEEKEKNKNSTAGDNSVYTPIKVLTKPQAGYTARAQEAGVLGTIRVLAAFSETGKVEHVVLLTRLGFGLDEEAVKAAKKIKFKPATRDGKPVMTVKTIEYVFTAY